MSNRSSILFPLLLILLLSFQTVTAQRKTCIDAGWRFQLGDGRAALSDPSVSSSWRSLDLPHDWSVEPEAAAQAGGRVIGPFSTNSVGKYQTGHTVGGEGWYLKHLTLADGVLKTDDVSLPALQSRFSLYFEGAYNQTWVYINGTLCHENVYGYTSFRVEISDLLHEGDNTLLVRVSNQGSNSRWYAGSGIYRHVWLIATPCLHLDEWDTFINIDNGSLKVEQGKVSGSLTVETRIYNDGATAASGSIDVDILDAQGTSIASARQSIVVEPGASQPSFSHFLFGDTSPQGSSPETVPTAYGSPLNVWSPASPYLYRAVVRVSDGSRTDVLEKRFGVRHLSFSSTEGFLLNGQPTLLRGGCVHHDNGLLGAAAFDAAERRKLRLIKAQGFNAVRCSHNLPSETFLEVCDELGLMVIDECFDQWLVAKNSDDYHLYFPEHSSADIATMVRRDRNHPSVIIWSIGNEIPGRVEPAGIATASRLRAEVLKYDTSRPITAAICLWDAGDAWNSAGHGWDIQDAQAFESLDVGGYNYLYDKYERDHQTHPERVMCGLESYPKQASENWTLVERLPYVVGDFVWTAMDYLGEAGIGAAYADRSPSMFQDWPWFNGNCGDLDLIGQKKPQSYYRDIVWRQAAVTMAVQPTASQNNAWGWQLEEQHWTWPGREGQLVTVNVYSRAPGVRLYLNGTSLGDRHPGSTFWTGYTVAYQPGTLRVVNLDADGNECSGEEFTLQTTGPAVGVRCVYENPVLLSDRNDLAYVTLELVDANGHVVTSDCSTRISIRNIGAGELIACGTGSPTDMHSFRSATPVVFRGRALAILRSGGQPGAVQLEACIVPQEQSLTQRLLSNADFGRESLEGWTVSPAQTIRYNASTWHSTVLSGFLECYSGWGSAATLAGHSVAQCTKVLPAGQYTFSFDYNGTFRRGTQPYQTDGTLSGVVATVGGQRLALQHIHADEAQHASLSFTLDAPSAVSFVVAFSDDTNADWFALDNLQVAYVGDYDFAADYTDLTSLVPPFDGHSWLRLEGNASSGYTESKLSSPLYGGSGLAFWSADPPQHADLFRQDITGLPEGRYGITALCAANRWSHSDDDRDHRPGTYLFARTIGGTVATTEVTGSTYDLHSLVLDVQPGETLTLGMNASADNGNNWCYLAGITLVRLAPSAGGLSVGLQPQPRPSQPGAYRKTFGEGPAEGTFFDLGGRRLSGRHRPPGIYIAR